MKFLVGAKEFTLRNTRFEGQELMNEDDRNSFLQSADHMDSQSLQHYEATGPVLNPLLL